MSRVSFVRGFKRPSDADQIEAIGDLDDVSLRELKWFQPRSPFGAVPQPSSDVDWLAQYREPGQTFDEFLEQCPWMADTPVSGYQEAFQSSGRSVRDKYPSGRLYMLQLGDFSSPMAPDGQDLRGFASTYLHLPVDYLGVLPLVQRGAQDRFLEVPEHILQLRDGEGRGDSPRKSRRLGEIILKCRRRGRAIQWHCPSLLRNLRRYLPKNALALIALTMADLYETEADLFVAGLASGNERVAVFSFARYDPAIRFSSEFWYDVKIDQASWTLAHRRQLVLLRSFKLIVHELGHLLGFDHCIHFTCCMNGSGHLEEDFRQPILLCPCCLRKLKALCDINIPQRYRALRSLFAKHGMAAEVQLINVALK